MPITRRVFLLASAVSHSRLIAADKSVTPRGTVRVTDPPFGAKGDWNGSSGTDDTTAVQAAVNSGAKRVVFPAPNKYFVNGAAININVSDFELVVEAGAEVVKGNSGATFQIGSVAGSSSNITISGRGKIRPSAVPHSVPSAGILVGASGATVDNLKIDIDIVDMGQYGIVSGHTGATITNFSVADGVLCSVDPTGVWSSRTNVAQAFNFNLPMGRASGGRVGAARFKIIDGVVQTDAFKWTNFSGVISGALIEGGSATVLSLSNATNFAVRGVRLVKTYSGGAGLAIGLTSGPGQITDVEAQTLTSSIPMFYYGGGSTIADLELSNFRTNGSIGAAAGASVTNAILRNVSCDGGGIDFSALRFFSGGLLDGVRTAGRVYLLGNNNILRNFYIAMRASAIEGIQANGNGNQILEGTVVNTNDYGVRLVGHSNVVDGLVADNCKSGGVRIESGGSNFVRKVVPRNGTP